MIKNIFEKYTSISEVKVVENDVHFTIFVCVCFLSMNRDFL